MSRGSEIIIIHHDWKKIVITTDREYFRLPRDADLITSICINHTENPSSGVEVQLVINGRIVSLFHLKPGAFLVHEIATAPIRHAPYMELGMYVKLLGTPVNPPLPKIYLRTSVVSANPDARYTLIQSYAETVWFFQDREQRRKYSTYGVVDVENIRETYIDVPPVIHSVQDLREALRNIAHSEQRAPFYKWVPLDALEAYSDEEWPDIASSLCVFNPTPKLLFVTCNVTHHMHEYVIRPGVNVLELFSTEICQPSRRQLQFRGVGTVSIFLRVGWAGVNNDNNPTLLMAPTTAGINEFDSKSGQFLRHKCSAATQQEIFTWLYVCRSLAIFQTHPLSDQHLSLVVGNYLGNCF